MSGHGRPRWLYKGLLLIWAACHAGTPIQADETPAALPWLRAMQDDAELTDVAFVDARHGWAVGDQGAIWATSDGGRRWRLQTTGVACRLESVSFLDAQNGWAAGGFSYPYLHTTQGVLLRTRDGGRTWLQDKTLLLPALKRVKFFGGAAGWAFGESSALFPQGIAATQDGGRSWSPCLGLQTQSWLAGDFLDPASGALAGRSGTLAAVRRRTIEEAVSGGPGLRGAKRVKLAQAGGWLVGDGDLVLASADLGRTWQAPPGDPRLAAGEGFDWRAVEVRGSNCWLAGSPGTKVLHSADGGRTWQAYPTGQTLPINALAFCDDQHGWAVGALGMMMATSDSGRTWKLQRAGGKRAALLAFYSEADAVPLELFARLCGNEGYLGVVDLLVRRDQEPGPSSRQTSGDRARAALAAVGVSATETAWAFPVRQAGLALSAEQLADGWDRANDGQGIDRLKDRLVRRIRTWRPDVVLTHAASLRGDDPLGHLVNQVVLQAVQQAADPHYSPAQSSRMGLEPWEVKKVFGGLAAGQLGQVNVTTAQLAGTLGCSLAEQAAGPRGLIHDEFQPAPATFGFRLYVDTLPQGLGERDFFSGITLHPAGEARRATLQTQSHDIDLMRRMAHKHRNVQAILAWNQHGEDDRARFLAQIGELTDGLDDLRAGELLYQLAQEYCRSGRFELAVETFGLLAAGKPQHPLTPAALVWMVQYWSSGEAAWRAARAQAATDPQAALANGPPAPNRGDPVPPLGQAAGRPPGEPAALELQPLARSPEELSAARAARAVALCGVLQKTHAAAYAEPSLRFMLAAAQRRSGLHREAERFYHDVIRTRPHDAWWAAAAAEQWLLERTGEPPKSVARATTGPRPYLDGLLDDAIWRDARPQQLTSALGDDGQWPAVALVAYDERFLYLALDCRQAPGAQHHPGSGPRPHDADLSRHDRVDFFIDLDRDWTTYYRLSIDCRGWTGEACVGDAAWNPTWFVAARPADGRWTAEAAIALDELSSEPPAGGPVWALGVQRTVPGVGFQSWTTPAATAVMPEGFGYLIFD